MNSIDELTDIPPPPFMEDISFGKCVLTEDLEDPVSMICQHVRYLSESHRERLKTALKLTAVTNEEEPTNAAPQDLDYGADFDLAGEVEAQIMAVRAIRTMVLDDNGAIKNGVSSREAKEVITSGGTMLTTLMKFHSQVVNMERLRHLESAILSALEDADEGLKEQVLKTLEERLESVA